MIVKNYKLKKIAIFASGTGTNAENIIRYFSDSTKIKVVSVFTNNANALVIERAKKFDISCKIFNRFDLEVNEIFLQNLIDEADYIVLAGFLWLIPKRLIDAFPQKIINIHPALLPKYGGKGMFGMHVHRAVIDHQEKETGITIHFVDEKYDEGAIILQKSVKVDENDTPESIAEKIHQLEYGYFPKVIEKVILKDEL